MRKLRQGDALVCLWSHCLEWQRCSSDPGALTSESILLTHAWSPLTFSDFLIIAWTAFYNFRIFCCIQTYTFYVFYAPNRKIAFCKVCKSYMLIEKEVDNTEHCIENENHS